MRISVLAVLVVTFLLVSDSEERWIRRIRLRRFFKYGLRVMRKRDADNPPDAPSDVDNDMDQATAIKKLQELHLACTNFGINGQKLTKETVMEAFDKVDVDNDNALDEAELDELEDVLDAYEACAQETNTKQG